jgi:hypothetical protein
VGKFNTIEQRLADVQNFFKGSTEGGRGVPRSFKIQKGRKGDPKKRVVRYEQDKITPVQVDSQTFLGRTPSHKNSNLK